MGLFGKILSGLEVIGGAALMFVPGFQLAGAMLITSGLASSGLIKGSIGKFLNSGWGQGLMAAVSLGSTAYAMWGSSILQDAATQSALTATATGQAESAAAVSATQTAGAQVTADLAAGTGGSDLLGTGASIANTIGVNTSTFANAASAAVNGIPLDQMVAAQSVIDPLNPEANLAMSQTMGQTQADAAGQGATNAAVNPGQPPGGGSMTGGPHMNPQAGVTPEGAGGGATGAAAPSAPTNPAPGDMLEGSGSGSSPGGPNAPTGPDTSATGAGSGGFLDKALAFADKHPGVIEAGGKALGGVGQGMMEKQAMDDKIRGEQFATRSYMDPQVQSQIQGAAAAPITVPSGYLQRAQALRTMLNNSGVQPGKLPTPGG